MQLLLSLIPMKTDSLFDSLRAKASLAVGGVGALLLCACAAPAHIVSSAGDTAAGAVKGAGKTAASATRAATKTAASAVGTAGQVVHSGVNVAGGIAKATVGAAADVVTAPFIILKDTKSGKTCRVPWQEGLTLTSALQEAKANAGLSAVKVLRGKEELRASDSFPLKPGDLIELTAKDGGPALMAIGAL